MTAPGRAAEVYPASLPAKGAGFRYQAWCQICKEGENTKSKPSAQRWANDHNKLKGHQ